MSKKLTILVAPQYGVGHVNATIGIAEALKERGHRIVYVVSKAFEGRLKKYGFEEELLIDEETGNMKPGEQGSNMLKESGLLSNKSSYEKMKMMSDTKMFNKIYDKRLKEEKQIKEVMNRVKPDIILIDDFIGLPSLIHCGKPWVYIASANPLFYIGDDERLSPAMSGYAVDSDRSNWAEFKELRKNWAKEAIERYNSWMNELRLPTIDPKQGICVPHSPYLNIYGFPKELDYTDIRPNPEKWIAVDSFIRKGEEEFEIPEKFRDRDEKTQKLIYLSLGSMGSVDVELMKKLVNILSKSPHKFIVSKGILGDSYELADNMWGQNSVPQTNVLPLVDLVITHGGNNSVTETFSFGKPMIVMPLFADQFDNAQRVQEKGFGIRIELYDCTEEELLNAIEKLLNDQKLHERLRSASKRIAESQSLVKAVELIESLAK